MEYINCPICGKNDIKVIFKKGNLDKDLINVICKNCSLVYINPRSSKIEYNEFHKTEFLSEKNIKESEDIAPKLNKRDRELKRVMYEFVKEYIGDGCNILDIGCGFGTFLDIVKKEKPSSKVYGVELGDLDVSVAKEYYGLDLFHGSLEEFAGLQENNQKFDVIVTHHTFEHLPAPLESLEQIKRLLKPNGVFYIAVPNLMNIKKRPDILFQIGHPFTYSPYSIKLMLEKAGFGIVKFNRSAGYPGGFEFTAKPGVESIRDVVLEKGSNYEDVIAYVNNVDKKFKGLRSKRDKLLFFLPKSWRIKIGYVVYKFLKNR